MAQHYTFLSFTAFIEYNNTNIKIDFFVVKSSGNPYLLFGRDLLNLFHISWIQSNSYINNINCPEENINDLTVEFKAIFENKTREYKQLEIHLELNNEEIHPIFRK